MMDEISTGLDSSTTFQITKILANFTCRRKATVLLALLQPAPEVGHRHPLTQRGIMSISLRSHCSFICLRYVPHAPPQAFQDP